MNSNLSKKVENLFEQSNQIQLMSEEVKLDKAQKSFQTEDRFQFLENLSHGQYILDEQLKTQIFFDRLIPFFEAGFLFKKQGANSEIQKHFILGKSYKKQNHSASMRLPSSPLLKILRSDSSSLLKKLGLAHVFESDKCKGFYILLSNDYGLILITQQAEPWLQLKMESLQKALIQFSCEYEPK